MAASSYKSETSVPDYKGFGRAVVWKGKTDDFRGNKNASGSSNQANYGFGVMIIGKFYIIAVKANRQTISVYLIILRQSFSVQSI